MFLYNNDAQKKCGFCGETIPAKAGRCPYCGSLLEVTFDNSYGSDRYDQPSNQGSDTFSGQSANQGAAPFHGEPANQGEGIGNE
jgi:predicted ATP-dependent serine protease